MRVLIGADGSERGTKALLAVGRILAAANEPTDLMCVAPRVPERAPRGHQERLQRRAHQVADKVQKLLAANGVSAHPVFRTGSPARLLIGASHSYDVTVVAAESNKMGPMAGLGPVAGRVAEHARGAVLLAREGGRDAGIRILVPVDGSDGSLRALETMAELVDLSEAEVTLLYVAETPWLHAGPDQEWLGYEEDTEEEIDSQAQFQEVLMEEGDAVLLAARQKLPAGCAITTLTKEGLPAEEILSEADAGDYDLVVVGASGSADLKHKMLGSVSSKVAWNAPCSVLLTSPAGEPGA